MIILNCLFYLNPHILELNYKSILSKLIFVLSS